MNMDESLFLLAAEERSFTKAARRAFVTQQCLSAHIKKLEKKYQSDLFNRTSPLSLTPAGNILYQSLRKIQIIENSTREILSGLQEGTRGSVTIGMSSSRVFVPTANEVYTYDADGNQTLVTTGTGAWQVEYNGENRPVKWTYGDKVLHMAYDHQGRRRLYVEVAAGVTNKLHRFTYDDYVCIARNREVDAQHGIGSDAFVWDPTEPIATRPLMCDLSGGGALLYCHDGNKNVSETVSLYGTIAAHYEYSSFGKVVLVTSENEDQITANLNPYRFSSEYADDAFGLVYYNYRHYNPKDGRWMGRDPREDIENLIRKRAGFYTASSFSLRAGTTRHQAYPV